MSSAVQGRRRAAVLAACAAGLFSVLWVAYRVAFDAPFYLDSRMHLLDKTNLRMTAVTWQSVVDAAHLGYGGKLYRPLANLSLALTHLFYGLDPRAYRVGNLAIHWGASLAAFFLFSAILSTPRFHEEMPDSGRWSLRAALLATGVWSLHPIQTNAVTYVIQRMASLCGLFSFLSVGAYLRCRSRPAGWSSRWALLSLVSFVLALASKENAATLLLIVPVAELTLLAPPESQRWRRHLCWAAIMVAVFVGAALVWRGEGLWRWMNEGYRYLPFTMGERLLTEARLQIRYLLVLLVPDPRLLTLDAEVGVSRGLFSPHSTAAAVALVSLGVALSVVVRRRNPLLSFGILWFFVTQAAESTFFPLELYFEHRMYLPSALLYLCVSVGFTRWVWRGPSKARVGVALSLAATVLAGEAWATYARNALWAHPVAFWADAVAKSPGRQRAYVNLADALTDAGRYAGAQRALEAALCLPGPKTGKVLLHMAAVARQRGDRAQARQYLERALVVAPRDLTGDTLRLVRRALAGVAFGEGRLADAQVLLSPLLADWPADAEAWNIQGAVYLRQGKLEEAETALKLAVRFDPASAKVWSNVGVLAIRRGDRQAAQNAFARASALDPKDSTYRQNLAETGRR